MKYITYISLLVVTFLILSACGQSNEVAPQKSVNNYPTPEISTNYYCNKLILTMNSKSYNIDMKSGTLILISDGIYTGTKTVCSIVWCNSVPCLFEIKDGVPKNLE